MLRSSGNRTARTKFILEATCHTLQKLDPLAEFQHSEPAEIYETIKAGTGISIVKGSSTELVISITDISGVKGTYNTPSSLTVDNQGRITGITPGLRQESPFMAITGFENVTFLSHTSISATQPATTGWLGRWAMKTVFPHPFRLSFTISASISLIGIANTKEIKATNNDDLLCLFAAAFYFDSPTTYCVLDNTFKVGANKVSGLRKIGMWNPTDRFSILFNGHNFLYYRNGIKVYTERKGAAPGELLHVVGCFHTKNLVPSYQPQVITNLDVQDVFAAAEDNTVVHSIMKCVNGIPMMLCNRVLTLVQTTINTIIHGNISVWGSIVATGHLTVELSIIGSNKETSVRFEIDGVSSVFHGTDEYFPPGLYRITLNAIPKRDADSSCDSDSDHKSKSSSCDSDSDHKKKSRRNSSSSSCDSDSDHKKKSRRNSSSSSCHSGSDHKSKSSSCDSDSDHKRKRNPVDEVSVNSSRLMVMGHLL